MKERNGVPKRNAGPERYQNANNKEDTLVGDRQKSISSFVRKAQEWIGRIAVGYAAGTSLELLCTFLSKCD
jgi:hypothetical protein